LQLSKRTNLVASNVAWSSSVDFAVDCYRTVMCCAQMPTVLPLENIMMIVSVCDCERVCLLVYLSVCTDIPGTTRPNFIKFSTYVLYTRMYFGFVDDVTFSCNGPYGNLMLRSSCLAAVLCSTRTPLCVVLVAFCLRRLWVPRIDKSSLQGVRGAEYMISPGISPGVAAPYNAIINTSVPIFNSRGILCVQKPAASRIMRTSVHE